MFKNKVRGIYINEDKGRGVLLACIQMYNCDIFYWVLSLPEPT